MSNAIVKIIILNLPYKYIAFTSVNVFGDLTISLNSEQLSSDLNTARRHWFLQRGIQKQCKLLISIDCDIK